MAALKFGRTTMRFQFWRTQPFSVSRRFHLLIACGILPLFALCQLQSLNGEPPTDSAEWPQILGPQRNGLSAEKGLLDVWPAGGPKEVWRAPGGVGMSCLAISRGRLITAVQKD